MSIITLYLIILVVALVIGNLLLIITKPKMQVTYNGKKNFIAKKGMQKFYKDIKSLDLYLKSIHKRVISLEKTIEETKKLKKSHSKTEFENIIKVIGEKLHKLENFKANTEIEMQAIKEIALDMRKKLKSTEEMEVIIEQLKDLITFKNSISKEIKNLEKKLSELYNEKNKLANHKLEYDSSNAHTLEKDLETFKRISLKKKGLIE